MKRRWVAVTAAMGLFALPALAAATSQPILTDVRIGDHPAFVRVVLDFNGKIAAREVQAGRFAATRAFLSVTHPGVVSNTTRKSGDGVGVAMEPGTQMLKLVMSFARHRFKYLSYAVVTGDRLAIDLWKSVPRGPSIHTCSGLTISGWAANGKTVRVPGSEHGIFENQFQVIVRGANGGVLGRKTVHGPGKWVVRVPYHVAYKQPGTVEAVAFSAKDGSLECLAQRPIELPPN